MDGIIMSKPRKTFPVDTIRDMVNQSLRYSTHSTEARMGMIHLLENVLHGSENYHGFRYLGLDEVPTGELPGIRQSIENYPTVDTWAEDPRFNNTDDTRRHYF